MNLQRTLKKTVTMTGIGLHSGKPVTLSIRPSRPNSGISFVRTDIKNSSPIRAHYENVICTKMATTLGLGSSSNVKISTVEHVMAALYAADIDNAILEVDGPEIPIMDGSATPFLVAIASVGTVVQTSVKPVLALRKKVEVKVGEKWAFAAPSSRLEVHASVDWDHPAIGYQEFHYVAGRTSGHFYNARTFGFLKDYEMLKNLGLAKGGSLDNAVVLDDSRVLNPLGLRHPEEFARHKVLDALGDFKLSGIDMCAFFRLHRAGHDLHNQLLGAIFSSADNYEIIDESKVEELLYAHQSAGLLAATAS